MRIGNAKVIKSIFVLVLSMIMCVSVAFAWFYGRTVNTIYTYSGSIDLSMAMYGGRDSDFDGVLDRLVGNVATPFDTTGWSRADYLHPDTGSYLQLVSDQVTKYEDIFAGKSVTYKIVLINNSDRVSQSVSVNFADMRDYFYLGLTDRRVNATDLADTNGYLTTLYNNYLANNTSFTLPSSLLSASHTSSVRLMFCITDLAVRIYSADSYPEGSGNPNSIASGFSTLISSSVNSEIQANPQLVQITLPTVTDYNLSNFSMGEDFVGEVALEANQLMEIDFKISNLQDTRVINSYIEKAFTYYGSRTIEMVDEFLQSKFTDQASTITQEKFVADFNTANNTVGKTYQEILTIIANDYITKMCRHEVDFLFASTTVGASAADYKLNIDYFEITGTQLPNYN